MPLQCRLKIPENFILADVTPVLHQMTASDDHVLHASVAAGEDPAIKRLLLARQQFWMFIVKYGDIGAHARRDGAHGLRLMPPPTRTATLRFQPCGVRAEEKRKSLLFMVITILYRQPYTSEKIMLLTNLTLATMTHGYGLISSGSVAIEGSRIAWVGPSAAAPAGDAIDCGGRLLTPGLIDCHTHLVYGGNRAQEFEMRLNGASYADIARAGGGIASTVGATRAASEAELLTLALKRLDTLLGEGITTLEIKSGYGLDVETEMRMLRVARRLGVERAVDVVTTYLGAHTFPPEHKDNHPAYLKLICEQALPTIAREQLADAVDAFCEGIAFSVAETEQVFIAAKAHGLPIKLHAEQLSNSGGAKLAARALGLRDRGQIAVGLKADLALWDADRPGDLAYPLGFNPLAAVIRNGELVRGQLR